MKKVVLFLLIALPLLSVAQNKIKETQVPRSVLNSLDKKYDSYKVKTWYQSPGQYIAEFVYDGQKGRAYFTHNGDWQYSSFPTRQEDCPTAMNRYFVDNYPGYRIRSIDYVEQMDGDVYYRMMIVKTGVGYSDNELIFDPRGRLQKSNAPDPDAVKREYYTLNNPDSDVDDDRLRNLKSNKGGKRPSPVEDVPEMVAIDTTNAITANFNKICPHSKVVEGPEWVNRNYGMVVAYYINRQGVEMEEVYDVATESHIMSGKVLDKDHYTAAIVKYIAEKFKGEKYKIERMIVYTYDSKWRVDGKKPKPYTYVVVSQKVKGLGNKLKYTRMEFDASGAFTNLLTQPIDKNDIQ